MEIHGYDFNQGCDLDRLLASMLTTGLQASALGQAINEVNRMVSRKLQPYCTRVHAAGLPVWPPSNHIHSSPPACTPPRRHPPCIRPAGLAAQQ